MTTIATPKQRKPRPEPARSIHLTIRPEGDAVGALDITVGTVTHTYLVTALPSDFGRAFQLDKLTDDGTSETYALNLDGERSTCECKGFHYHGHCKHVAGLQALVIAGRL